MKPSISRALVIALLSTFALAALLTSSTRASSQLSGASEVGGHPAAAREIYENPALGYRITLPPGYRRALSVVDSGNVGHDAFTARSDAADGELCARERASRLQPAERQADIRVIVHGNTDGASALAFVSAPNRRLPFSRVESLTVNGLEAARIVFEPSGDTAWLAIRANGRLYEIHPFVLALPSTQPKGWLDQTAASFELLPTTPTASDPTARKTLCGS